MEEREKGVIPPLSLLPEMVDRGLQLRESEGERGIKKGSFLPHYRHLFFASRKRTRKDKERERERVKKESPSALSLRPSAFCHQGAGQDRKDSGNKVYFGPGNIPFSW